MGKLYKIEFEDWGWQSLLGMLESYIGLIDQTIEQLKKEPESPLKGGAISGWTMVKNEVSRYKHQMESDLKTQGWHPLYPSGGHVEG